MLASWEGSSLIFIAGRRPHGDAQQLREQIRPLHLSHVVDEKPARRTRTPEPGRIASPQCCGLERAWPHQRLSWQNVVKGFMKIESPLSIETPGSGGSSMSCGVGAAGAGGRGTVCDATRPDSTHAREFREDDQEAADPRQVQSREGVAAGMGMLVPVIATVSMTSRRSGGVSAVSCSASRSRYGLETHARKPTRC